MRECKARVGDMRSYALGARKNVKVIRETLVVSCSDSDTEHDDEDGDDTGEDPRPLLAVPGITREHLWKDVVEENG